MTPTDILLAGNSSNIPLWIYTSVFLLGFLESLPFVGSTFPATVLMTLTGFAAFFGWTDGWTMLIVASAGGMLSVAIGYEADSYVRPFIQKRPILLEQVSRTRTFMARYGLTSIFLARFHTFTRSLISLVAAENDVPRLIFYSQSFFALAIIISLRLSFGYLSASALQFAFYWVTQREGFLLGVATISIPFFILWKWAINKGRSALIIILSLIQSSLRLLSKSRIIGPLFTRYPRVKTFIHNRFSRTNFFGIALTCLVIAFVYIAHLLTLLILSYIHNGVILTFDTQVANLLLTFRTAQLTKILYSVTLLASPQAIIGIMIAVSAVLWVKHHRTYLLTLWLSIVSASGIMFFGKQYFHRARPSDVYAAYHELLYSLPSAHAMYATVLYGTLTYIVLRSKGISWRLKISVLYLMILCISIVSFSRVYLGVHYASDVLAGILIGLLLLIASITCSESISQVLHHTAASRNISRNTLIGLIGSYTAIIISVIIMSPVPIFHVPNDTIPEEPIVNLRSTMDIFTTYHQSKFTETLNGKQQEPINIIVVSSSEKCVKQQFANAHWKEADPLSPQSTYFALRAAVLNEQYPTAPMTPYFYATLPHTIGLQRETDRKTVRIRHHLRLWKTNFWLPEGQVYLGTASFDRGIKWGGWRLGLTHRIDPDLDKERDFIANDLSKASVIDSYTKTTLTAPFIGRNFSGDPFVTDGQAAILVLRSCAH